MWWALSGLCMPVNGDFEDELTGWSAPAFAEIVVQGEAFREGTEDLLFPSPTHALLLEGPFITSPGRALTDGFLSTHTLLELDVYDETHSTLLQVRGPNSTVALPPPSVSTWATVSLDLTTACGAEGVIELLQAPQTNLGDPGFTLVDDVRFSGVCDVYVDLDDDGQCERGNDDDDDGFCLGDEALPSPHVVDCGEGDPTRFVGAIEVPDDGIDQDCNGFDLTSCFQDLDFDGYGGVAILAPQGCNGTGLSNTGGDCDDLEPSVHPGMLEICDGVDTNCDGIEDTAAMTVYTDLDGDGWGENELVLCGETADTSDLDGDCDDDDDGVFPTATEIPGDGVDSDCDERELCYTDQDGDGYAGDTTTPSPSLTCAGLYNHTDDCNDSAFQVFPDATEACDGRDTNCNGEIDEGRPRLDYFEDQDGDGYGGGDAVLACSPPEIGWLTAGGDCDDADHRIHPDAIEVILDGVDQDCSGGDRCYLDGDEDGYGVPTTIDSTDLDCDDPGEARNADDCTDTNPARNPGATEIPDNGLDEDCDGVDGGEGEPGTFEILLRGGSACSHLPVPSLFLLRP